MPFKDLEYFLNLCRGNLESEDLIIKFSETDIDVYIADTNKLVGSLNITTGNIITFKP